MTLLRLLICCLLKLVYKKTQIYRNISNKEVIFPSHFAYLDTHINLLRIKVLCSLKKVIASFYRIHHAKYYFYRRALLNFKIFLHLFTCTTNLYKYTI